MKSPPLALYAHFPWCVQKCPYCDFNSHTLRDELPEQRYVDALLSDLDAQLAQFESRPLTSIFLGGGTPSLFSPAAIGRLIEHARTALGFEGAIEITMEANPGTIERGKFAEYRAAGVTRVSLGAQSFDARQLKLLGRIHSADETRRAAEELHAAGIENFNLDLMYALPGQTAEEADADVRAALALEPAHLSHYHLTIEPGTLFAAAPPVQPADEIVEDMLDLSLRTLVEAGFEQYEVSGYARAGAQCVHNLNYWQFGDYLGIGAGAHGKLSYPGQGLAVRTQRTREPRRYLAADPRELVRKAISIRELPFEFAMNGFRLVAGFADDLFESRTGLPNAVLEQALSSLTARGLVERGQKRWRATPKGFQFLNEILVELLPDAEPPAMAAQILP
ncbi:MAG TPA: radical SAM family heme chaperone HemW [Steroidobacteraceae bacterium]|jgi:oxygen-independent coproporphyrinogen-3 oxidase|nr:radical SAM family heme chaperone HemW [Steroidobacteraceae bacterium]